MTPAWLRPRAEADLVELTAHYVSAGGHDLGRRFFDAALAAVRAVEGMPGIGSPTIGEMCEIPGLRAVPVEGFPVHWYYLVADAHLDVIRLLAVARDLPTALAPAATRRRADGPPLHANSGCWSGRGDSNSRPPAPNPA